MTWISHIPDDLFADGIEVIEIEYIEAKPEDPTLCG